MDEKEKLTFEDAMKRLESIVETLGGGNLSLEDSLKMFEEGMELCKICNKKLDEAEYKVEKLMEKEGGELSVEQLKVGE
ncbi:MAG: exodeoxyribonuclease VII small subunit [Halobacteriota archaeon]|jgi:exodeoxyribonuclease VII small subunit|uniref:Exodeoxyribonuclease 7 small subunit n=1 Tax=Candidatus Methanophaga sp. ANME-1 ERB7 TaxID=2759913 RepID=A0A7G9Z5A3_9EURY|nr:exodeoxyribonuclease 7 small subunit [Methanosarcinales archaeon ANME-1 ERB7]